MKTRIENYLEKFKQANELYEARDYTSASICCELLLKSFGNETILPGLKKSAVYFLLAQVQMNSSMSSKTYIANLNEAIKLDPNNTKYLALRFRCLVAKEKYNEAYEDLNKLSALSSLALISPQSHARILFELDRFEEAIDYCQLIIKNGQKSSSDLHQSLPFYLRIAAESAYTLGKHKLAKKYFEEYLQAEYAKEYLLINKATALLGCTKIFLNDIAGAKVDLQTYLAKSEDLIGANLALDLCNYFEGDHSGLNNLQAYSKSGDAQGKWLIAICKGHLQNENFTEALIIHGKLKSMIYENKLNAKEIKLYQEWISKSPPPALTFFKLPQISTFKDASVNAYTCGS